MCKSGKYATIIMSALFAVVLSLLLYYNIIVINQVGREVDNLTKYVQDYVNKNVCENVDFAQLQRANVFIINGEHCGSGTVISMRDGYIYILTARHIVEEEKDTDILEVEVPMVDENYTDTNKRHSNRVGCQYIVVDKANDVIVCSDNDMALIRIKGFTGHQLSAIQLSPKDLEVGDTVFVIGNPMCNRDIISRGMYTGQDTHFGVTAGMLYGGVTYGNSGGAVINSQGKVCGVVFAKALSSPVSHVGVFVLRKPMMIFVVKAFDLFEKETK